MVAGETVNVRLFDAESRGLDRRRSGADLDMGMSLVLGALIDPFVPFPRPPPTLALIPLVVP